MKMMAEQMTMFQSMMKTMLPNTTNTNESTTTNQNETASRNQTHRINTQRHSANTDDIPRGKTKDKIYDKKKPMNILYPSIKAVTHCGRSDHAIT
jgi:hypothetical protein